VAVVHLVADGQDSGWMSQHSGRAAASWCVGTFERARDRGCPPAPGPAEGSTSLRGALPGACRLKTRCRVNCCKSWFCAKISAADGFFFSVMSRDVIAPRPLTASAS
jgi:hypothetical protein